MFKNLKKSTVSSLIILVSTFFLALGTSSASVAQAASPEQAVANAETLVNNVDDSDMDELVNILSQSIYKVNGVYKFDSEKALELGLAKEKVDDLNQLYTEVFTSADMETLHYELQNYKKSSIGGQFTTMSATTNIKLLWSALITFVGATIAANVIADAYKLSAAGACKKWKSNSGVKKACKQLGYL